LKKRLYLSQLDKRTQKTTLSLPQPRAILSMGCFSSKPRRYISEEGEAVVEEKMEKAPKAKKKAQTAMKKIGEELVKIVDSSDDDSDGDTAEILQYML